MSVNSDEIKKAVEYAVNSGNADNLISAFTDLMDEKQKNALDRILADPASAKKILESQEAASIAELLKNMGKG